MEQNEKQGQILIVTLPEFARLMKVSTNTVRSWINKEKLRAGNHYFREGRVIRFLWGPHLVRTLMQEWAQKPPDKPRPGGKRGTRRTLVFEA